MAPRIAAGIATASLLAFAAANAAVGLLPRSAIVGLSVVQKYFPQVTQEQYYGSNATAAGDPIATRSVIYVNDDGSKKVTLTVDRYVNGAAALSAYREAVAKSKIPGFSPLTVPTIGQATFAGSVTRGAETHLGVGALDASQVVGATLAGYSANESNVGKLSLLARVEAAAANRTRLPSVNAQIDALVRAQVDDRVVPGIAIAIAKNGRTIYTNAVGLRDLSARLPMRITTPQAIGSITKQFTAASILMLAQDGKLSIDDKLSKYVPEYRLGSKITLRQMLNMVSGISDNDPAIYGDELTQPISRGAMLANLNKLPLMYAPGTRMVYTNTNYNLLGLVVERVSKKPYLTFLRERIFAPLGMTSSATLSDAPPGMAKGYAHLKPGQAFETRPEMNPDFAFGTGNMISTPLDLLKWDTGLLGGRILSVASLRTMFTVPGDGKITTIKETDPRFPSLKNVSDGSPTVYAMGWMCPYSSVRWHGGHTFLFESTNVLFSDGYTIAIEGNVRDGGYFEPENLAATIHNTLNPSVNVPPLTVIVRAPKPPNDSGEEQ
ncbi:MAG: beta-lactamase family protein [Candidatus Eremiobacteraeota bacterium]|nr:beta-lactamase family protein [Candidatus Eremiobacteraeota bacterium]